MLGLGKAAGNGDMSELSRSSWNRHNAEKSDGNKLSDREQVLYEKEAYTYIKREEDLFGIGGIKART